jgi:FIMAH domain
LFVESLDIGATGSKLWRGAPGQSSKKDGRFKEIPFEIFGPQAGDLGGGTKMRNFPSRCVSMSLLLPVLVLVGVILGSAAWATDLRTQGIVTQIQNYEASGDIYESAAAEDLKSELGSVDSALAQGDNVAAQSLLAGFVHAVKIMEGKLISSEAASRLIDAANTLSLSL